MSQSQAIRQKLDELTRESDQLKASRNDAVLALAAGDSKAAKKLATLSASIPALDEQISAYEAALDFALDKDKADALEAGLHARVQAADDAVAGAAAGADSACA